MISVVLDINISFLAHSSLLALVYIPPSILAGIVVVNHFHLRVPKRHSVLPLGACTRGREAAIACAAYLDGAWKAQFCFDSNSEPPTPPLLSQAW